MKKYIALFYILFIFILDSCFTDYIPTEKSTSKTYDIDEKIDTIRNFEIGFRILNITEKKDSTAKFKIWIGISREQSEKERVIDLKMSLVDEKTGDIFVSELPYPTKEILLQSRFRSGIESYFYALKIKHPSNRIRLDIELQIEHKGLKPELFTVRKSYHFKKKMRSILWHAIKHWN